MKINLSEIHDVLRRTGVSGTEAGDLVSVAVGRVLAFGLPLHTEAKSAFEAFQCIEKQAEAFLAPINEQFPIDFSKVMLVIKGLYETRWNLVYPSSVLQVCNLVDPTAIANGAYGDLPPSDPRVITLISEISR